jgi:acetolactate synthase-1/3 small subunit
MKQMDSKFTVSMVVDNQFGVLNRIAGLYAKRGYNIDSLAVGETENPRYSRMTIVSHGDNAVQKQVCRQLQKIYAVKLVISLPQDNAVSAEHMLIKLSSAESGSAKASSLINNYGGKVMDFGSDYITAEITGDSEKIMKFIDEATPLGILELCRRGVIGLIHGTENNLSIRKLL